jgi:Protein of unknown function (DUF3551)
MNMRQTLMASAIAVAALLAIPFGSAPAQAQEYPWCRLGNHDCMYSTYAQCMAALSGTFGDCRRNPVLDFYAEAPVAAPGYAPRYHHHYRPHRHHHGRRHHY